ncbi:hypothetical protein PMG11_07185 [Penicillium brasilianum]|uniref:F-box domain-containing protein n=1 Tax=Penicillium brasilianum TaxID=104259 RepID=A0A0F7TRV7_PENBI|nr:hypothetical protein PMG11_07185 [Penicillium brasilianum]
MSPTTAATNLDLLPPELLLLISQYLSTVDSTCLALCSHRFFTLPFGDFLYRPFPLGGLGSPAERIDLLTRLTRHLPEYYLCYACMRMHLWRHVNLPCPDFKLMKCYDDLPWDKRKSLCFSIFQIQFPTFSTYRFYWLHLYLTMRRYYLGPSFGIPLESLLYTEVTLKSLQSAYYSQEQMSETNLHPGKRTGLKSIEARICPISPSLCLRIQELAIASRQSVSHLLPRKIHIEVCRHIGTYSSNFIEIINSLFESYRQQGHSFAGLSNNGKCHECNTAWDLDLREVEVDDVCLTLTRWKDLGPGLSPDDPRWRIHIPWGPYVSPVDTNDPRIRFEMHAQDPQGLSFDDMLARNLALLQGRRYRRIMKKWGPGWWILQGHEDETKRSWSQCVVI